MKFTPPEPTDEDINVTREHPLREFLISTSLILLAVLLLLAAVTWLADALVGHLPPAWESKYLSAWMPGKFAQPPLAASAAAKYNEAVFSKLIHGVKTPYDLRIKTICSKEPNAFAFLGGSLGVTSGLLRVVTTENALAFVLAHEIGHALHRHPIRSVGRGVILVLVSSFVFGSADSSATDFAGSLTQLAALKFSREQELEADAFAADRIQQVYGHLNGAAEFFEAIKLEHPILDKIPQFMSTHPGNDERIEKIRVRTQARPSKLEPIAIGAEIHESAAACETPPK